MEVQLIHNAKSKVAGKNGGRVRMTNPCDGCALRRVRCEGGRPCKDCQKRCLECTFLRVSKKRGPKGPRRTTSDKIRALQHDLSVARATSVTTTITTTSIDNSSDGVASNDTRNVTIQHRAASTPSDIDQGPLMGDSGTSTSGSPPYYVGSLRMGMALDNYTANLPSPLMVEGPLPKHHPQPLIRYRKFLDVFKERLYSVWPVLCHETIVTKLSSDPADYDTWAMAAAVCAGVISQLRLPEHCNPKISSPGSSGGSPASSRGGRTGMSTSHDFAADALYFREQYEFRERPTIASLLTSFFLHIHCANSDLLGTAAFHIRDALTQAHVLGLHRTSSYGALSPSERELRLRVYWVLFVSERTFSVQRGLPTVLKPIGLRPSPDEAPDGYSASPILSFLYLTNLFTFLDGDLIEPPSETEGGDVAAGAVQVSDPRIPGEGDPNMQKSLERVRNKIAFFQSSLGSTAEGIGLDETQRVDISVTRNWIRILLWEYTIRHFPMSCTADDQAFSMLLPALVSHEMLGLFSGVSGKSICAHGFGMELKVFRIADSLLDVLACGGPRGQAGSMLVGSRDALHSLEKVLCTVGGPESLFLKKLRGRMSEVDLPLPSNNSWLELSWLNEHNHAVPDDRRLVEDVTYCDDTNVNADVAAALELDDAAIAELTESFENSRGGHDNYMNAVYDFARLGPERVWEDVTEVNN